MIKKQKKIDLNQFERREYVEFFLNQDYPMYNICVNIDITNYLKKVKEEKSSFYYSFIHTASQIMNEIEAFRYRFIDKEVVLFEKVHPAFTDLPKGGRLYKNIKVDLLEDRREFIKIAKNCSENQKEFYPLKDRGAQDVIYISCLPWVSFTSCSHPIALNKQDAIPRLSWGKYFKSENKILMPLSLQSHHAFVDGVHVGEYYEKLQMLLDTF